MRDGGEAEGVIAGGPNRTPQMKAERARGMTRAKRQRFLEVLAATSNVVWAAAAAGDHRAAFYKLRQRDAGFRAEWKAALEDGYEMLEQKMLARALGAAEPAVPAEDFDGKVDFELGDRMLGRRDAQARGGSGYGRQHGVRHVPIEEVEQELLRHLAIIAKRLSGKMDNGR